MAPELYGSDPNEKDARFNVYLTTKHLAFNMYLCELLESSGIHDLVKWYFSDNETRSQFAEQIGISFSSKEDFLSKVKAYMNANKHKLEKESVSVEKRKNSLISNGFVWKSRQFPRFHVLR